MSGSSSFISDIGKRVIVGHHYFVIDKVIAEGGYGVVFLVRDGAGRRFALKRMYVNDESRLADCRTEIEIISSLSGYKNIIKYVDSSIIRLNNRVNEVLILTDYYPVTCAQVQEEEGVLAEREVLKIFCDMCEALSILHHSQIPIIHRDMKLENILRDYSGNYVLCDLGSATLNAYISGRHNKTVRDLEEEFHKHTTVSHRAPEIVDFYTNQNITTKIDIWALGVTLYRLCFNNLPFGESTLSIQSGQFTIPEDSAYSQDLHSLIYYCLEVDPERRPDIFQVSTAAFRLIGRQSTVHNNINNVREPTKSELIEVMRKRQLLHSSKRSASPRPPIDMSEWVETTTVRPRERPKPGRHLQPPTLITQAPTLHANNYFHQPNEMGSLSAVPVADLLGVTSHTSSMTRSLDSDSAASMISNNASPFGDDFSQFDPSLPSRPATISAQKSSIGVVPQHSLGFEDSFADLLIQPSQKQAVVGRPHMAVNHLMASDVRGHRRYKSDSASMITGILRQRSEVSHSVSTVLAPNHLKSSGKDVGSFESAPISPFEDDFSSFSPSQLTDRGQKKPSECVSGFPPAHGKHQVDAFGSVPFGSVPFGSVPFNPSLLNSSSQQTSWNCPSDRNTLPGFS